MGAYQMKELSPRHLEVLRLSALGMKSAEIQKQTGVSTWHQARIRRSKLGRDFLDELNGKLTMMTAHAMAASMLAGTPLGNFMHPVAKIIARR